MKKDVYIYPAILSYDEDGISVEFPDLPGCLTCGDTTEDALISAKEAMALHLFGMEEDDELIPEPTTVINLKVDSNQVIILVDVYMPQHRDAIDNSSVKKTLTIPRWLNVVAEKNKINFSQVLQTALKERLNMKQ